MNCLSLSIFFYDWISSHNSTTTPTDFVACLVFYMHRKLDSAPFTFSVSQGATWVIHLSTKPSSFAACFENLNSFCWKQPLKPDSIVSSRRKVVWLLPYPNFNTCNTKNKIDSDPNKKRWCLHDGILWYHNYSSRCWICSFCFAPYRVHKSSQ